MATYTGSSGSYKTTLTVTETSYSTQNNTSTLSWSLKLEKTGGSGLWHSSATCPWSVSIPGSTVVSGSMSGSFSYDFRSYSSLSLGSGTVTVPHNSDGTKTVSVSASVDMDNSDYVGVMRPSGSLTLTTIPRASSVTVNATHTISSSSGNLSYSVTSKANFYHKAIWSLGGTTTGVTLGQINATTTSFNITNKALLNALPDLQSSTLSITVNTFSDSNYSNLIGSSTASCVITITLKPSAPTLTTAGFRSRSTGVNASITSLTAGFTTAAVTAWSHGITQGATGYTTYFSAYYGSSNTAVGLKTTSATTANTVIETQTLPASAKQYTLTISAYTTDSRGLSSTAATTQLTVYGYSIPALNLTAYRVTDDVADESTTRDDAGVTVRIAYSNVLRGQTDANGNLRTGNQNQIVTGNSNTFCKYGNTIASGSPLWVALPASSSLTVTYQVKDYFTTTSTSISVPTASFPLDLYDDGRGAVGVGLGAIAKSGWISTSLNIEMKRSAAHIECFDTDHGGRMMMGWGSGHMNHGVYSYGYAPTATTWTSDSKWLVYRDKNGAVILNGNAATATTATNADRATNATYTNWTETNPTSATTYYLPFGTGYTTNTTNRGLLSNDGFKYQTREGSTSQVGYSIVILGNATASGTAGNKKAYLRMYGSNGNYGQIHFDNGNPPTATRNFYLPDGTGTIVVERQIWTGKLYGGKSLTGQDFSGYSKLKCYFQSYGPSGVVEVDLTHSSDHPHTTGYPYYASNTIAEGGSGDGFELHFCTVEVNTAKTTIVNRQMGYVRGGSDYARNGDSTTNNTYYIYRIDGVV